MSCSLCENSVVRVVFGFTFVDHGNIGCIGCDCYDGCVMSMRTGSIFLTKAVLLESACWDWCRCIAVFSWVYISAGTLFAQLAITLIKASAKGMLFAACLSLLTSSLRSEGRYRAVVGVVIAGGTALTELCVRGGYKCHRFEAVRGATQCLYQSVSLYVCKR